MKVPLCRPALDSSELTQLSEVLQSGWLTQGPKVARLEEQLCDYLGCNFAVAVSSGSTALHLALLAAEIGPGDEVILPAFTWVATAAAVVQVGAAPVFADIDINSYNVDIDHVARLINPRTKALLPVSLFGSPAGMTQLENLAAEHDLIMIEDAACSLGAKVDGRQCGTIGSMGCFSFHPRKSITCGEGGVIVGSQKEHERLLRSLRNHGMVNGGDGAAESTSPWFMPDVDKLGYNYRLSDVHAAVLLPQLARLDEIVARRRQIADFYNKQLSDLPQVKLPDAPQSCRHTYQSYVVKVLAEDETQEANDRAYQERNEVMSKLQEAGIQTRPGTQLVPGLSYYRKRFGCAPESIPRAIEAERQIMALPLYPQMSTAEMTHVVTQLRHCLEQVPASAPELWHG